MQIKQLKITSFGKLQAYTLDFLNQGGELIVLPNESGKSTLLAFIRACFYGLGDKRKAMLGDLTRRDRYTNFSGQASGGSLIFTIGKEDFELSRKFGLSAKRDQIQLFSLTKGEAIDLGGKEPGEYLFNLSENEFLSSVLIEQMQVAFAYKGKEQQDVVNSLSNLGLIGTVDFDIQAALNCLDVAKQRLQHKKGKGGLIYEATQKLAQLQAQQAEVLEWQADLDVKQTRLNLVAKELNAKQQELANLQAIIPVDEQLKLALSSLKILPELQASIDKFAEESLLYQQQQASMQDLEPLYQKYLSKLLAAIKQLRELSLAMQTMLNAFENSTPENSNSEIRTSESDVLESAASESSTLESSISENVTAKAALKNSAEQASISAKSLTVESTAKKSVSIPSVAELEQLQQELQTKDFKKDPQTALNQLQTSWELCDKVAQKLKDSLVFMHQQKQARFQAEIADLQAQSQNLLKAQIAQRTADEAELKNKFNESFTLSSQSARLEQEVEQLKNAQIEQQNTLKKLYQRKSAKTTRLSQINDKLAELATLITAENERLLAGEAAIKECAQALELNQTQAQTLKRSYQEQQTKWQALTVKQVKSRGWQQYFWGSLVGAILCSLIGGFGLIKKQLIINFDDPILVLSLCLFGLSIVAFGFSIYAYCSYKKFQNSSQTLQTLTADLAHLERDINANQAAYLELQSEKLALIQANQREQLKLYQERKKELTNDLLECETQKEQLAAEIDKLTKQRQAQTLTLPKLTSEWKNAELKAEQAAQLVVTCEEFINNTARQHQAKQSALSDKLATLEAALATAKKEYINDAKLEQLIALGAKLDLGELREFSTNLQARSKLLLKSQHQCELSYLTLVQELHELAKKLGVKLAAASCSLALVAAERASLEELKTELVKIQAFKGALEPAALKKVPKDSQAQSQAQSQPISITQLERAITKLKAAANLILKSSIAQIKLTELGSHNLELAATTTLVEQGTAFANLLETQLQTSLAKQQAALAELQREQGELGQACLILDQQISERANLANAIEDAEKNLAKLNQQACNLKGAEALVKELFSRLQSDFSPKLREQCSKYLKVITNGRYSDVLIDRDLHLKLRFSEDHSYHPAEYLSGGTYEQIYLALRLALSSLLNKDQRLPLFLDDSCIQFDQTRTVAALTCLSQFAKVAQRQIYYFTCQSHYQQLIEQLAPADLAIWHCLSDAAKEAESDL